MKITIHQVMEIEEELLKIDLRLANPIKSYYKNLYFDIGFGQIETNNGIITYNAGTERIWNDRNLKEHIRGLGIFDEKYKVEVEKPEWME